MPQQLRKFIFLPLVVFSMLLGYALTLVQATPISFEITEKVLLSIILCLFLSFIAIIGFFIFYIYSSNRIITLVIQSNNQNTKGPLQHLKIGSEGVELRVTFPTQQCNEAPISGKVGSLSQEKWRAGVGERLSCGSNFEHLSFSLSVRSLLVCRFRYISLS